MVGYNPKGVQLSPSEQAFIAGTTSILSRFFIQPFDVVKIRFQVQYEPISKKSKISKYTGISQTVSTIIKEEGLFALWKGHLTGQILSFSFITSQFFWFETITRYVYKKENNEFMTDFICGGTAATIAILTSHPIDVVRTRLVTQGEPRVYTGILDAVRKMYKNDGVRGFYRGAVPAVMLTAPEAAFRFGIYKFLNKHLNIQTIKNRVTKEPLKENETSYLQNTVNGSLAGVASKTIVYPFDLIKKRLQIQGFEDARQPFGKVVKFNGLFHCLKLTVKKEGFFGIYKGYAPSMAKAAFSSGIIFFLYESLSDMTKRFKTKKPIF